MSQGAYRGAYRRFLRWLGLVREPIDLVQPFTDDLDTAARVEALTKRIRG